MGRLHSHAYVAAPFHYPEHNAKIDLVRASDPDEARRAHAHEVLGFEATDADWRAVLDDPRMDVVSICAPNFLHHEIALAAIAAQTPLWIEKPMGRDTRESEQIPRAAEQADLVTSVGFNYRHAPAVASARHLLRVRSAPH